MATTTATTCGRFPAREDHGPRALVKQAGTTRARTAEQPADAGSDSCRTRVLPQPQR